MDETQKLAKIIPFRKQKPPDADTLPDEDEVPEDAEPGLHVTKRAMRVVLGTLNRWQGEHPDEVVRQGQDGLYGIAPRGSDGTVDPVPKADVVELADVKAPASSGPPDSGPESTV